MKTKNGDILTTHIDKIGIWLGINHCEVTTEIHLTPDEVEALVFQLSNLVFRLQGHYPRIKVRQNHMADTIAGELSKRLLSGVIKEK